MKPSIIFSLYRLRARKIIKRYPMFSNVRIFGSVARKDDKETSDIDIVVTPAKNTSLLTIGSLQEELEKLFSIPVNLISSRPLTGFFKQKLDYEAYLI